RASLTDKVAALEQQVLGTIQNASDTVSNIVETVKTAVPETLHTVKDTLTESVQEVSEKMRSAFDLSHHTREHPWAMVGGAAAAALKQSVQEGLPKLLGPEGLGLDGRSQTATGPMHPTTGPGPFGP